MDEHDLLLSIMCPTCRHLSFGIIWARWRSIRSNWRIFGFTLKWHSCIRLPLFRNVYATHMWYTWCAHTKNGNGANTIKHEKRWNEKHLREMWAKKSTHKSATEKWLLRLYYNTFFPLCFASIFELVYAFAHKREFSSFVHAFRSRWKPNHRVFLSLISFVCSIPLRSSVLIFSLFFVRNEHVWAKFVCMQIVIRT